jgi:hypothetical protein
MPLPSRTRPHASLDADDPAQGALRGNTTPFPEPARKGPCVWPLCVIGGKGGIIQCRTARRPELVALTAPIDHLSALQEVYLFLGCFNGHACSPSEQKNPGL